MQNLSKDWGDQFNKSVVHFTGRNKVYPLGDKSGGPVVTKTGPMVKAMLAVENADLTKIAPQNQTSKMIAAYKKTVKAFVTEKTAYAKHLAAAIKAVDKREHPEAYRELKTLSTRLDALQARVENNLAGYENRKENDKIFDAAEKKINKARDKGDMEGAAAIREVRALTQLLLQLRAMGNSGIRKGLAAIQIMKKDPTVATYNKNMNNAGRDVSQWVNNIEKMKNNQKLKKNKIVMKLPDPTPFTGQLTEFGDGAKRSLDANTTPEEVAAHIKEFAQLIKAVAVAYDPVLKFKG